MPNAIELLEEDHRKVKKLLEEGDDTPRGPSRAHRAVQRRSSQRWGPRGNRGGDLLPALKEHPKAKEIVLGIRGAPCRRPDHGRAGRDAGEDGGGRKVLVMKETSAPHEEEEDDMFRRPTGLSKEELTSSEARWSAKEGARSVASHGRASVLVFGWILRSPYRSGLMPPPWWPSKVRRQLPSSFWANTCSASPRRTRTARGTRLVRAKWWPACLALVAS